ncbi:MAG: nucleoside deaminase [Caldisericia bacterium]|nr:nucleoside deaminase [Caldisericia bacterium]
MEENQKEKTYAQYYMQEAIKEADKAAKHSEVPIGCVIVNNHQIIARSFDTMESDSSVLSHAEIKAIKIASELLKNWRLIGCDLFVTVEPCIMCMGAIILSRIQSVFYGVQNEKTGAFSSPYSISNKGLKVRVYQGIQEEVIKKQLSSFFETRR